MKLKRPEREVLYQMYHVQKMTQEEIGFALAADRYTIRKWMKYYKLGSRITNQKRVDETTLRTLYEIENKTQEEIAKILEVHPRSVRRWMKYFNIAHRPFSGETNGNYKHGKARGIFQYRRVKPIELCELCEKTENLCIHHKDFDHYNNHPDNLQVLCVSCHRSVHKQAYWDAIKAGHIPPKSNAPIGWDHEKTLPSS